MMGEQARTESLFYYFRLEEQIPEDHLLRLLDRYIDFSFVRERLKTFYSATGRPSIDPEVLLRLLLVGYLYGITSERRLPEEVRMHLAYRWFTRLDFEQEIPGSRPAHRPGQVQLNLICGFNEPHHCHYPSLIAQWRIPLCTRSPLFSCFVVTEISVMLTWFRKSSRQKWIG